MEFHGFDAHASLQHYLCSFPLGNCALLDVTWISWRSCPVSFQRGQHHKNSSSAGVDLFDGASMRAAYCVRELEDAAAR